MSGNDPTYLGVVSAVSGATLTVKLAESLDSGFAVIYGHTYRVGQVGSFVEFLKATKTYLELFPKSARQQHQYSQMFQASIQEDG